MQLSLISSTLFGWAVRPALQRRADLLTAVKCISSAPADWRCMAPCACLSAPNAKSPACFCSPALVQPIAMAINRHRLSLTCSNRSQSGSIRKGTRVCVSTNAQLRTYAKDFPADVAALNDFLSWDSFIADAKAAFAFLQAQPEVEGKRVIVAGHSEGATFAMQIGHDLQGTPNAPAGLILMGSPGRTGGAIISEQVTANLKRVGLTEEQRRPYTDYVVAGDQPA